jgi:hypothetical protein
MRDSSEQQEPALPSYSPNFSFRLVAGPFLLPSWLILPWSLPAIMRRPLSP